MHIVELYPKHIISKNIEIKFISKFFIIYLIYRLPVSKTLTYVCYIEFMYIVLN